MAQQKLVSSEKTNKDNGIHQDEPQLRFKEFTEPFKEVLLGDISSNGMYGMNCAAKEFDGENKYIRITDIDENSHNFVPNPLSSPDGALEDKFLLKENDIVFARTGASTGKSYLYDKKEGKLYFAGFLIKLEITNAYAPFVYYNTLRENYDNWVSIMSVRSGQPGINLEEYKKFKINLPSFEEQKKISSFLSAVDKKIELLEKKCNLLNEHKKGFIQKLRKGEIKFQIEGKDYPKWEEIALKDILYEHKLKSTGKEEVYSVSVHKGVVNQIEHLGRSYATDDLSNYKLVKPGDIIYTKSPTAGFELGIIKQNKNDKNVLVSPLYGVFSPETIYLGNYIDAYFESSVNTRNYLHPIVQKGAKNTMNITNKVFLSRSLLLPTDYDEQKKISDYIDLLNKKYDETFNLCENMKNFKKGLLQKMFV